MIVKNDTMLSAYLDDELSPSDRLAFEQALADDVRLSEQMAALKAANDLTKQVFAADLEEDVPDHLVASIMSFEETPVANEPHAPSGIIKWPFAAVVAALCIGVTSGFFARQAIEPETAIVSRGWLDDIADYHRVYSKQVRHLVEVGAEEADHIERWLTNTVGAPVKVPDLSEFGLEFKGARLLVAAGKPVAQLAYLDAEGSVVALCIIQTTSPRNSIGVEERGEFEMVFWGGENSNLVIVGDLDGPDIETIARSLAVDI